MASRKPKMPETFTDVEEWKRYEAQCMPEKGKGGLQVNVDRLAESLGWLCYHTKFSIGSGSGFPDCVYLRGNRAVVAELKRVGLEPTPNQQVWLDAWGLIAGVEVYHWTPLHWVSGEIADVLA